MTGLLNLQELACCELGTLINLVFRLMDVMDVGYNAMINLVF